MKKIRVFSLFLEFEVRLRKFEFDFDFRAKVRQVRSSDMSKFGCSKFDFFEFVPPLFMKGFSKAKKLKVLQLRIEVSGGTNSKKSNFEHPNFDISELRT